MTDRKFLQETNFDDDVDFDENKENELWRRRLRQREMQKQTWENCWLDSSNCE